MFTQILNIVVLLAKPSVVIVIVQRSYCCYCSTTKRPVIGNQKRCKPGDFVNFAIFFGFRDDSKRFWRRFRAILSGLRIRFNGKSRGLRPSRPNVGLSWGAGSQVLAHCCSRGLLLASVVGQAHCCSVVIVQHFNTVGQSTLKSSRKNCAPVRPLPNRNPPHKLT